MPKTSTHFEGNFVLELKFGISCKLYHCTFQEFNNRSPEMHKAQGAKCAISNIVYGSSVCTNDNHSIKLVAYRPAHTDDPYRP